MSSFQIRYIGDLDLPTSESAFEVGDDRSYVKACIAIRIAIQNDDVLNLLVRKRHHAEWLKDYFTQLHHEVDFSEDTPRTVLNERWGVNVPDWLSDENILNQGLLRLDVKSSLGKTFEVTLINHLLGVDVDSDLPSESAIADLVAALSDETFSSIRKEFPILEETIRRLATVWGRRAGSGWLSEVCEYIPDSIEKLWHLVSAHAILHSYPNELLDRVLPAAQAMLARKLPVSLSESLSLEARAREEALTQVELLFSEIESKVTSQEEFRKIVSWMSGRTAEEFRLVEKMLKNGRFEPTEDDVRLVRETFDRSDEVRRSRLESLIHYVRPAYPTLIGVDEDWSSDKWVHWVTEQYAPFRDWQIRNEHYDSSLEETVCRFSDWYIEQHANLQADTDRALVCALNSIAGSIREDQLTVILMVDCLPVSFFGVIDHALRTSGFKRHDLTYRFAALPTVTEFNKPAVISGNLGRTDKSYLSLLTDRAATDWGQVDVHYVSTLRDLSQLNPGSRSSVVLVNYIEGDEIFHTDVESNNRTYEEELSRSYAQLSEALSEMCEQWTGPRENVEIMLLTDHGACRILEEERRGLDSAVVSKIFDDERHRVATMTASQAEKVPGNLWDIGYRFTTPFAEDDAVHFLPRGHNTVRKTGISKKYVHGGAAPEEVIVPTARYGLVAVAWKKPFTRFLNLDLSADGQKARFYIQRVVKVEVEIQNPNTVVLHPTALELLSPDASVKGLQLQDVLPGSVAVLAIDLYFQKASQAGEALELKLRYTIGGDDYEQILTLPSEFKSAMAGGFSLKDL